MTFLRGLSLVAFEQGRFEAASMTDFGRDVLEVIEPVSTRTVDGPRVGANDAISVQVLSLADIETDTDACQTEVNESQFEQINAVPFSQIHSITRVTSYLPFVLPETGIFKFTLSTGAGDGDPFLVLMDEKCTLISYNDDFGNSFNSELEWRLDGERIVLAIGNLDPRPSQAELSITKLF